MAEENSRKKQKLGSVLDGLAPATHAGRDAAIIMFDKFMEKQGEPKFDELGPNDALGDNLKVVLVNFAEGLLGDPPTKGCTGEGGEYTGSTLIKYFNAFKNCLIKKFPEKRGMLNDQAWVKEVEKNLPRLLSKKIHKGTQEDSVISKVIPLFRKTSKRNSVYLHPCSDMMEPLEVDLVGICSGLMNSNIRGSQEKKLQYNITHSSVGRGGEIKFINYDKMYWEPFFQVTVAKWFQMKQVTSVPTSWCVDFEYAETCIPTSFACFWMVENGLARSGNPYEIRRSSESRAASYVFQSLQNLNDGYTSQLSNKLKTFVPEELKSMITMKSLRIGASTELAANRGVQFDEKIARGGWSTGTSQDHYTWILLCNILSPMLALAGYPDPTITPVAPTLDAIGKDGLEKIDDFICALYIVHVPHFFKKGKLRPMLEVATASVIMHFTHFLAKYGRTNTVVDKMIKSIVRVGLATYDDDAVVLLSAWSSKVKEDFYSRVTTVNESSSEILNLIRTLQANNSRQFMDMRETVSTMLRQNSKLTEEITLLKEQLVHSRQRETQRDQQSTIVANEITEIKILLQALVPGKIGSPRSPTELILSPALLQHLDPDSPIILKVVADEGNVAENNAQPSKAKGQTNLFATLRYGKAAEEQASDAYFKNKLVSDVLMDLFDNGKLKNLCKMPLSRLKCKFVPTKNSTIYMAALDLVEALLMYEDCQFLINASNCSPVTPETRHKLSAMFLNLDYWVRKACSSLLNVKLTGARKAYLYGTGNVVKKPGTWNLVKSFIPAWTDAMLGEPNIAPDNAVMTFREWVNDKQAATVDAKPSSLPQK
ncbi:hypothetical protein MHU86_20545 [Fragilaria crotonensis]|nr:hypothetical protein MHU86_20545 [Fragilaria crotonensis]